MSSVSRRTLLGGMAMAGLPAGSPKSARGGSRHGADPITGDALLAGFGTRQIRVLSGAVGLGKTRLALQAALACCMRYGEDVVFIGGRESPTELLDKVGRQHAHHFSELLADYDVCFGERWQHRPIGAGSVWIEDPRWQLETSDATSLFEAHFGHRSGRLRLVVVDVLASSSQVIRDQCFPAASAGVLAKHQVNVLETGIPRLLVVDKPPGGPLTITDWHTEIRL
jgi:hypothetical protein